MYCLVNPRTNNRKDSTWKDICGFTTGAINIRSSTLIMCLYHFVSFHCHNGIAQLLLTVALLRNLNCLWKLCSVNQPGSTTGVCAPDISVPVTYYSRNGPDWLHPTKVKHLKPITQRTNLHKCNFVEFDGLKGRRRLSSYQVLCVTRFRKKKSNSYLKFWDTNAMSQPLVCPFPCGREGENGWKIMLSIGLTEFAPLTASI